MHRRTHAHILTHTIRISSPFLFMKAPDVLSHLFLCTPSPEFIDPLPGTWKSWRSFPFSFFQRLQPNLLFHSICYSVRHCSIGLTVQIRRRPSLSRVFRIMLAFFSHSFLREVTHAVQCCSAFTTRRARHLSHLSSFSSLVPLISLTLLIC